MTNLNESFTTTAQMTEQVVKEVDRINTVLHSLDGMITQSSWQGR